jgi:hypothetical protein
VVDMTITRGFYTIINVHHDASAWADLTQSSTNVTMVEEKMYRLWYQIGTKLACKGSQLAFEPINEIPATTPEHGVIVNRLNNIFLQAINDAGGFNAQRVVTLVGAGEDGAKTSQWFQPPDTKFKNPWGIQYHYYSPCKHISSYHDNVSVLIMMQMTSSSARGVKRPGAPTQTRPHSRPTSPPYAATSPTSPLSSANGLLQLPTPKPQHANATLTSSSVRLPSTTPLPSSGTTAQTS